MAGDMDIDRERVFPKYTRNGFVRWFNREAREKQKHYPMRVAFFHGCSTEFQHPEVGEAFVKVMNAVGVGVELIDEKCCGVAMISNGLWNSAKRHAEHNVREFTKAVEEGLPVVGVSSTCVFTMRDEYPDVLDVDNSKVRDSITLAEKYLFELVDSGKVKLVFRDDYRARIAYHVHQAPHRHDTRSIHDYAGQRLLRHGRNLWFQEGELPLLPDDRTSSLRTDKVPCAGFRLLRV